MQYTGLSLYKRSECVLEYASFSWLIYISFLCTALGRPTALQSAESDATEPDELPLLKCFVKLAKISLCIKKMHQDTDQSLETFSKTCTRLVHDLHEVARYAKQSLGLDIGQKMQVKDCGMPLVLLKLGILCPLVSFEFEHYL